MKRIAFTALVSCLTCSVTYGSQNDTTTVGSFSIEEQNLTMAVGESRQLHILPSDSKVRWSSSWHNVFEEVSGGVVFIDDNGFATAIKKGSTFVQAELNSSYSKCTVEVTESENGIRSGSRQIEPAVETKEYVAPRFSLEDGVFSVEGVYQGSGSQPSLLKYIVTNECIFLDFEINYTDSTKSFYQQPFSIDIEGCQAESYTVYFGYFGRMTGSVEDTTAPQYAMYSISRGGGTTRLEEQLMEQLEENNADAVLYDLNGRMTKKAPGKGIYIRNGRKYIVK